MTFSAGCIFDDDKDDNKNSGNSETYTISGKITDSNNNGIADVVISITGGITYNTKSTGLYIFTDISNGTYTIIPSKHGYTFEPEIRQVPVSGENVSGLNFTGTFNGSSLLALTYIPLAYGVSYNYNTLISYTDESQDETEPHTDAITGATAYTGINYWVKESTHNVTGELLDLQYLRITDNILLKYLWGKEVFAKASAKTPSNVMLPKAHKELSEIPMFNFNLSPGESWEIYKDVSGHYTGTYLGIEDIIVSAGTFQNCTKFKLVKSYIETFNEGNDSITREISDEETFWFAPNVGPVKKYYIMKVNDQLLFTKFDDLISYTIP